MPRPTDTLERDRKEILTELDRLLGAEQIDPEEHRQRTEVARRALDETELASVRPSPPSGPAQHRSSPNRPAPAVAATPSRAAPVPLSMAEERGFVVACMGASVRKGAWEPPETLYAFSCMGGIDLDFREAALLEGTTDVQVLALMGGIKIVVPDDIDVEVNGFGFMGGFEHVSQHVPGPGRPLLRIRGLAIMGGVSVKVRPAPGSTPVRRLAQRFRELV